MHFIKIILITATAILTAAIGQQAYPCDFAAGNNTNVECNQFDNYSQDLYVMADPSVGSFSLPTTTTNENGNIWTNPVLLPEQNILSTIPTYCYINSGRPQTNPLHVSSPHIKIHTSLNECPNTNPCDELVYGDGLSDKHDLIPLLPELSLSLTKQPAKENEIVQIQALLRNHMWDEAIGMADELSEKLYSGFSLYYQTVIPAFRERRPYQLTFQEINTLKNIALDTSLEASFTAREFLFHFANIALPKLYEREIPVFQPTSKPVFKESPKDKRGISVYPNPVSNMLYITHPDADSRVSWAIYDMKGIEILHGTDVSVSGNSSIDVSSLASGIYILQYNNGKTVYKTKFIVVK